MRAEVSPQTLQSPEHLGDPQEGGHRHRAPASSSRREKGAPKGCLCPPGTPMALGGAAYPPTLTEPGGGALPWQAQAFWKGFGCLFRVEKERKGSSPELSPEPLVSPQHLWARCHGHPHPQSKHCPALRSTRAPLSPQWEQGTRRARPTPPLLQPVVLPGEGRKEGRRGGGKEGDSSPTAPSQPGTAAPSSGHAASLVFPAAQGKARGSAAPVGPC